MVGIGEYAGEYGCEFGVVEESVYARELSFGVDCAGWCNREIAGVDGESTELGMISGDINERGGFNKKCVLLYCRRQMNGCALF